MCASVYLLTPRNADEFVGQVDVVNKVKAWLQQSALPSMRKGGAHATER